MIEYRFLSLRAGNVLWAISPRTTVSYRSGNHAEEDASTLLTKGNIIRKGMVGTITKLKIVYGHLGVENHCACFKNENKMSRPSRNLRRNFTENA